jgi:hypothetical protein
MASYRCVSCQTRAVTHAALESTIHALCGSIQHTHESGAEIRSCAGTHQVYYSVSNETFYSSVPKDLNTPDGVIRRSDSDSSSARILDTLHAAILEALQPVLQVSFPLSQR